MFYSAKPKESIRDFTQKHASIKPHSLVNLGLGLSILFLRMPVASITKRDESRTYA